MSAGSLIDTLALEVSPGATLSFSRPTPPSSPLVPLSLVKNAGGAVFTGGRAVNRSRSTGSGRVGVVARASYAQSDELSAYRKYFIFRGSRGSGCVRVGVEVRGSGKILPGGAFCVLGRRGRVIGYQEEKIQGKNKIKSTGTP